MGNRRVLRAIGLLVALILARPQPGAAHPLGNFSISQYAGIQIGDDAVALRYFIDMAEIPAFQELQAREIPADPADPRTSRYLRDTVEALKQGLLLEVDGQRLALDVQSAEVIFPPGAGELPTMKIAILFRGRLVAASRGGVQQLRYRDENYAARAGWKEVIAVARSGVALVESSVPNRDRSRELGDYPTDLLDSPPQVREARVHFTRPAATVVAGRASEGIPPSRVAPPPPSSVDPGSAGDPRVDASETPVVPRVNAQSVTRGSFTDLITTRELTLSAVVIALLVAAALGAFHALEPGHGKTVVAAYLVGSRGTARHALILGLIVTASHTAGVYLLGAITFFASQYVVPDRLYPWVALASGLTIAALGLSLFWRRFQHGAGHDPHHHHHHGLAHTHDHVHAHGHAQAHNQAGPHHRDHAAVSLRQLWALGITGGIVPCPAALVVLLSALSLRRVGFGLLLIVAFSLGLALVLIAIGMLMVYARRLVARVDEHGPLVTRWLPLASSAVMILLGVSIALQAVASGVVPWKLT
jgi:ABC-type nickel/cobalt efflux system permease component RcnA